MPTFNESDRLNHQSLWPKDNTQPGRIYHYGTSSIMRILHAINSLETGGAERLIVDLARKGNALGDDVQIVTMNDSGGIPSDFARQHNINVIDLKLNYLDPRAVAKLRSLESGFDILHAHLFPTFYWAALAKGPRIYTEHSTTNRRRGKLRWKATERRAYGSYDRLVGITQGVRDELSAHLEQIDLPRPVSVVKNGIRGEFFEKVEPTKNFFEGEPLRLVAIGSLAEHKNFKLAVETMAIHDSATLEIIGEGPLRSVLADQIAKLGLKSRVSLRGSVSNIPQELKNYHALLSTSTYEGFGLVAAEAMAAGLPVIGPRVPGFSEVVSHGESGLLFSEFTPQAVSRLISEFQNPIKYRLYAKNARTRAHSFSIDSTYNEYLKLYLEVLEWG